MEAFGNIIVIMIVLVAAFFVGRRYYRIFSKKRVECGCEPQAGCPGCSLASDERDPCCEGDADPRAGQRP